MISDAQPRPQYKYHIRRNGLVVRGRSRTVEAYCGETLESDPYAISFVFPAEVGAFPRLMFCEECKEHPDYAMYLLRELDE